MPKGVYLHRKQSQETINRRVATMKRIYGGSWNKGLTKSTDERVKKFSLSLIGHPVSQETWEKISANTGARRPEVRQKMRLSRLGRKTPEATRKKQSEALKGSKSHLWRGGITPIHHAIRSSVEYKIWRDSVFARDKYSCLQCGDARGGNLNADHIKPFAFFPELRFDTDNGRTLCVPCHKKTETYGAKKVFTEIEPKA